MRKIIFVLIIVNSFYSLIAQNEKFSARLSYPIPLGDNFVSENYSGIIDVGLKYTLFSSGVFSSGLSTNFSYLTYENTNFNLPVRVNATLLAPRIFIDIHSPMLKKFTPTFGIGYSFNNFTTKETVEVASPIPDENEGGFTFNIGCSYSLNDYIFTFLSYDYFKTSRSDNVPDINFNTQINIVRVGVGVKF